MRSVPPGVLLSLSLAACAVSRLLAQDGGAPPPGTVDLRARQSPAKDQGSRDSCVAFAVVAALEAFPGVPRDLSEEHAVHLMNQAGTEAGLRVGRSPEAGNTLHEAVLALSGEGVAEEAAWPYRDGSRSPGYAPGRLAASPSVRIVASELLPPDAVTLDRVERELASGVEVVLSVRQAWDLERAEHEGLLDEGDQGIYAKHCVLVVGYRRTDRTFLVKNSLGPGWGRGGYARMPYGYFEAFHLEALVVRAVAVDPPRLPASARSDPWRTSGSPGPMGLF